MDFLNKFILSIALTNSSYEATSPTIYCMDGLVISIQASSHHCCEPREDSKPGVVYTKVEVGFPSYEIP